MKTILKLLLVFTILASVSCKKEAKGRFNFPMIKSKINITSEQLDPFNKIAKEYTAKAKQAWIDSNGDRVAAKAAQKIIFAEQDAKIKELLTADQYTIYFKEVNIERTGREKHNMKLIKEALALDSLQSIRYDLANETFFTTLSDNHDNYHGKPAVYEKYFKEIDVNRRAVFKNFLTEEQYNTYEQLAEKYQLGKMEE